MSSRAVLPDAVIMLGRCFGCIQLLLRLFRATFTYLMHGFSKMGIVVHIELIILIINEFACLSRMEKALFIGFL